MKKIGVIYSIKTDISPLKEQECCGFKDYVTPDEIKIYSKMRDLRKKGVLIRDDICRLESLNSIDPAIKQKVKILQKKLEILRKKWNLLETLRKKANYKKMVMLGHEAPPPLK